MRFYPGSSFDNKGRLNIYSYNALLAGRTVMVYTTDEDFDLIHIDSFAGKPGVPSCAIRKVDSKGRIIIPKSLIRGATSTLISNDTPGKIVVKLIWENPG